MVAVRHALAFAGTIAGVRECAQLMQADRRIRIAGERVIDNPRKSQFQSIIAGHPQSCYRLRSFTGH
jgi:hypothetical protein